MGQKALFIKGIMVFLAARGKSITRGELEADPVMLRAVSLCAPNWGYVLSQGLSMSVLKFEQDTEWHWRKVLLSCLDLLSTAELSHR